MSNLLYVSFEDSKNQASGVNKKIFGQISAFDKKGYATDLIAVHGKNIALFKKGTSPIEIQSKSIPRVALCRWASRHANSYSVAYIRFQFFCPFVLSMVRKLSQNNVTVIMEVPTYPYENELRAQGFKGILKRVIDSTYGPKCVKYIDAFVSPLYSGEILGKKSIQIYNGIDVGKVTPRNIKKDETIDLLAVAMMAPWHGYDRVIEGLHNYYAAGGRRNVVLHLVGLGAASRDYQQLTDRYSLGAHVIQHGKKFGADLDDLYDIADIGVGSLATHRKNVMRTNTLKVLEYMSKGLPVLCDEGEEGIPQKSKYRVSVPCDDSPVPIDRIINFYDKIYSNGDINEITQSISSYCIDNCSIEKGLHNLFEFLIWKEQGNEE